MESVQVEGLNGIDHRDCDWRRRPTTFTPDAGNRS